MLLEQSRNLIAFILMLGGLILLHEAAHFLASVRLGVRVEEFGIGLPPRALKLGVWKGTILSLNWIPLGGFVRLKGETGGDAPDSFSSSAAWKRIVILLAGSAANLALGYLIFLLGFSIGWPDQVEIAKVYPGSPAEVAGIQPGDIVLEASDTPIHDSNQLSAILKANVDLPTALLIQRGHATVSLTVTPHTGWSSDGLVTGIEMRGVVIQYSPPNAASRAAEQIALQVKTTFNILAQLVHAGGQQANTEDVRLISPVGLKQVSDKVIERSIEQSMWFPILNLIAVVSTALGIANLLPLPALDGGRIVFVLAEVVGRKRVNATFERWVHIGGMLALYALTIFLVVNDVINPLF